MDLEKLENEIIGSITDFGELSADEEFKGRIKNLEASVENVKKILDDILTLDIYDSLSPDDKVRYDLFLAFAINCLYWFYLRTQGKDPGQTDLKNELNRVKEYMGKSRKLYERKHVMPRLDKGAANRFVKSGLWDSNKKSQEKSAGGSQGIKRRREDSAGD